MIVQLLPQLTGERQTASFRSNPNLDWGAPDVEREKTARSGDGRENIDFFASQTSNHKLLTDTDAAKGGERSEGYEE